MSLSEPAILRELAAEIKGDHSQPLFRRKAVVQAIVETAAGFTCTIRLGGSTVDIIGVPCIGSYVPVVNDVVEVIRDGPQLLVIGSIISRSPRGLLGYALWTGPNNEAYSADAQITGLSKAVTIGTSRRIMVSVRALLLNDANAGRIIGQIFEDGVAKDRWFDTTMVASANQIGGTPVILTPTAGLHTYTARLQKNTGAGTVAINNGASCSLLIEDIGVV